MTQWLDAIPLATRAPLFGGLALLLLAWGGRHVLRAIREPQGPIYQLRMLMHVVRFGRLALLAVGCVLVAIGGWLDDASLAGLGVVIALEELYETTLVLAILKHGQTLELEALSPRGVA